MLSSAQRHLVFDSIPCILCGDPIPILQRSDDIPNFQSSIKSWIVLKFPTENISSLYQGKGQLRHFWNPETLQFETWDGEILKATLEIDIRSVNKSKVTDYAACLVWDIKENLLSLSRERDKVWVGPGEIISAKDLGAYHDEDLDHSVHRFMIEVELEYEMSFKKPGYPITKIQMDTKIYPPGPKGVGQYSHTMKAPRLLTVRMSLAADVESSLSASISIEP